MFAPRKFMTRNRFEPRAREAASRPPPASREAGKPPGLSAFLSPWARQVVVSMFVELGALPFSEHKAALKQKLRLCHPDKRQTLLLRAASREEEGRQLLGSGGAAMGTEAQFSEVFCELKRRYDWVQRQEERLEAQSRRRAANSY